jgi:cyclophilin family peptidyl-prolyl cis-trans isomerase
MPFLLVFYIFVKTTLMNKYLLTFSLGILLVYACKKEDEPDKQQTNTVTTGSTTSTVSKDTNEQIIEITTAFGVMYMWLHKETPLHRANFLSLASSGYFDSTTFHRCVPDFVIQGGDPNSKDDDSTNDGRGGPPYTIPAEIDVTKHKHTYGAVGAARTENPEKSSNGSQFYIVSPQKGTPNLNGKYTVFGQILSGMEFADSIVKQPQNSNNRPYSNIYMKVRVVSKTRKELRTTYQFEAN